MNDDMQELRLFALWVVLWLVVLVGGAIGVLWYSQSLVESVDLSAVPWPYGR